MSAPDLAVDLDHAKIDPAWALRIPASLGLRRRVLPFAAMDGRVYVACVEPADPAAMEAVARFTGKQAVAVAVSGEALERALGRVYGDGRTASDALRPGAAEPAADDAVALVDELIRAAILRQASDIHIDPGREDVCARLRVDGALEEYRRLASVVHAALCSRIKVLAGMDIAERRAPQDGAFAYRFGAAGGRQAVDIRVASLPTRHGERLTLRLLATQDQRLTLEKLGMIPEDLGTVERVLAQPHGLVLLTGPTGSGKSTTLYAVLQRLLAGPALNIITVEDPIEYEMRGVAQVEVDSADKVSFGKVLRSLLRHDPDVVMIGEIRDADSLDVATKASLTGHLVLSTLHTNNAVSAVTRLIDMGMPPDLIGSILRLSIAQRLVRRLCPHCRRPVSLAAAGAAALGMPELAGRAVYEPQGCLYCGARGVAGRTGLFECLLVEGEMAAMISKMWNTVELAAALKSRGFRTLLCDGAGKVLAGMTPVNEVVETAAES
jgi:general secretion pathway protein E